MRKLIHVFLATVFVLFPTQSKAQITCGLNIDFQYILMNMWNKDIHRSDIQMESIFNPGGGITAFLVREEQSPIPITSGRSFGAKGAVSYRKCNSRWSFSGRMWLFNASASLTDTINVSREVVGLEGIRVGGELIFPIINTTTESGSSPIFYAKGNTTFPWTADLLGKRSFGNLKKDGTVSAFFGLRLGGFSDRFVEVSLRNAFIHDYFGFSATNDDSTDNEVEQGGLHLEGVFYSGAQSSINYGLLAGPIIGLEGHLKESKRLMIKWAVTWAYLFGRAESVGNLLRIEDLWLSRGPRNGPFVKVFPLALDYEEQQFLTNEKVGIDIRELDFTLYLALTKKVVLNVGGFVSSWHDVSTAPTWSSLEQKWTVERKDIMFAGLTAGLVFNFRSLRF